MKSKWLNLKPAALQLRTRGLSIRTIEKKLGVPRSTLSWWLRDVKLTQKQKNHLLRSWKNALVIARVRASAWHRNEKIKRDSLVQSEAELVFSKIDIHDKSILELALSILYLGEGFKKNEEVGLGNSDPVILKTFLRLLEQVYQLDRNSLRYELHLRADQRVEEVKRFWTKELELKNSNFFTYIDERTRGSNTYPNYKGVCTVRCGPVAIKRRLLHLSKVFCNAVVSEGV